MTGTSPSRSRMGGTVWPSPFGYCSVTAIGRPSTRAPSISAPSRPSPAQAAPGLHRGGEPLLDVHHQERGVLSLQMLRFHTAYPIAPEVAGACGSSITLTQATVPEASARSSARRSARAR